MAREGAREGGVARDLGELVAGVGAVAVVDRERGGEPLGDGGIGLAGLAVGGDAEEDERHRDHRDDHDDHEEQQQAAAKAHFLGPDGPTEGTVPGRFDLQASTIRPGRARNRAMTAPGPDAASLAVLAVVVLTLLAVAVWQRRRVRATVVEFFGAVDGPLNLAVARIAFFAAVLLWGLPAPGTVRPYTQLPRELIVAPSNLGKLLAALPLTDDLVDLSYAVMLVASILGLIGLFPRLSAAALVVAGFYYLGVPQLFGKVAHYHHVLWIGVVFAFSPSADALSVQALVRAWRRPGARAHDIERSRAYALPLRFIWLLMGLLYLSAGLAKYRFDGLRWLDPGTLGHWLRLVWYENGHLPGLLQRPDQLAPFLVLGAAFTILFECGWLLLVFHRRGPPPVLAFGGAFPQTTGGAMGVPSPTPQARVVHLVGGG